jgi:lysophospholipase L1-like esterase
MKTIVCYGDSNTWGYIPKTEQTDWADNRYDKEIRWPGVLQKALGSNYCIEEEGLNGRTTIFNDPLDQRRNGLAYIDTCLLTKMPVDMVILMLGTNDVKEYLGAPAFLIARGIGMLIERIQAGKYGPSSTSPKVLLISPPHLGKGIHKAWLGNEFGNGCLEKDAELSKYYQQISRQYGTVFLDASKFTQISELDCVHIDAENHEKLGIQIACMVQDVL